MAVFGKSPDEKQQQILVDLIDRVNENVRRLRVLEQKIMAFDTLINSMEQNIFSQNKNLQKAISEKDSKISKLEERTRKIETLNNEIVKQFKLVATKSDIEELKELVGIYNPLRSQFVTKGEAEKLIDEKLSGR